MMSSEWEIIWKCGPGIFVEGRRKTILGFSHDSRSLGRDLNAGPPEY
jgi:hypothetical protein